MSGWVEATDFKIVIIDLRACRAGTALGCGTTLAGFSSALTLILLALASRSTA